jgi:DNA repair ATPase RecN
MLAHALDLLLGGKPRAGIVRPGAREAYVEGIFELPDELRALPPRPLYARAPDARAKEAA